MKKIILGLLVIFSINLTAPLDLIGQDDIYIYCTQSQKLAT